MLHFVLERARPLSDHVFFPRLHNLRRYQLRRTDGNPSAGSERLTPTEKVHNAVQSDQRSRRTLDIADHQCAHAMRFMKNGLTLAVEQVLALVPFCSRFRFHPRPSSGSRSAAHPLHVLIVLRSN